MCWESRSVGPGRGGIRTRNTRYDLCKVVSVLEERVLKQAVHIEIIDVDDDDDFREKGTETDACPQSRN